MQPNLEDAALLHDMLMAARNVIDYTKGADFESFSIPRSRPG